MVAMPLDSAARATCALLSMTIQACTLAHTSSQLICTHAVMNSSCLDTGGSAAAMSSKPAGGLRCSRNQTFRDQELLRYSSAGSAARPDKCITCELRLLGYCFKPYGIPRCATMLRPHSNCKMRLKAVMSSIGGRASAWSNHQLAVQAQGLCVDEFVIRCSVAICSLQLDCVPCLVVPTPPEHGACAQSLRHTCEHCNVAVTRRA